jgi:hypothetical protein
VQQELLTRREHEFTPGLTRQENMSSHLV